MKDLNINEVVKATIDLIDEEVERIRKYICQNMYNYDEDYQGYFFQAPSSYDCGKGIDVKNDLDGRGIYIFVLIRCQRMTAKNLINQMGRKYVSHI